MASLSKKIEHGLNETRILVLGTQVLIGAEYRTTFEPAFERLPHGLKVLNFVALGLLLLGVGLLISPGPFQQIALRGRDTPELHRFLQKAAERALLPIALAFGLGMYLGGRIVVGHGAAVGAATLALALGLWFGVALLPQAGRTKESSMGEEKPDTSLELRIARALTEARVVLPGAQALLGFQFAGLFSEGFEKLPQALKDVHLVSLMLVGLAVLLLMSPAAWHRLVEKGEDTERFVRVTSRYVIASLVPLALALSSEQYVVLHKVASEPVCLALSAVAFAGFALLWFGLPLAARKRKEQRKPLLRGEAHA